MSFPIKNGDFQSYVSLPEGTGTIVYVGKKEETTDWQCGRGRGRPLFTAELLGAGQYNRLTHAQFHHFQAFLASNGST